MWEQGFLVVDKPPGLTSHDVVAIVRATTGVKKVGHTGTLDPFATGVLPLALGGATRLIQYLDENEKKYDALILLGSATDTGDPTGTVVAEKPVPPLDRRRVEETLASFVGARMQTPPRYSAVKVAGKPLYAYARKGQAVEVKARPIRIDGMQLLELSPPRLRVLITCSRGTYARGLAEEIGEALGTLGHLEELRRTGSGRFGIEGALSLSRLAEIVGGDPDWGKVLRPGRGEERVAWRPRPEVFAGLAPYVVSTRDALAHLPAVSLSALEARRYLQTNVPPPPPTPDTRAWALVSGGEVIGVGTQGDAKPGGARPPEGRPGDARPGEGRGPPPPAAGSPPPAAGGEPASAGRAPRADARSGEGELRRAAGEPGGPAVVRRRARSVDAGEGQG